MHNSSFSSNSSSSNDDESHIVTAEELMRRKRKNGFGSQSSAALTIQSNSLNEGDLDDEIKRLEAELEESSDSSGDDSSSFSDSCDSDDDESMNRRQNEGKAATDKSSSKDAVICLSSCASETIKPLDKTLLPACKSKKLKIDRDDEHQNVREKNYSERNGLRDVVKEVLAGYQPRSSERIPFYCRVCAVQSKDESEFLLHKQSEFHKTAVQVEKKATYCKLCRKQLTSLVQMQEHLDSRPHKERLNSMKARQRGLTGRRYGRSGGTMGRGNRFTQSNRGRGPRV
jgi:hypothetical protein